MKKTIQIVLLTIYVYITGDMSAQNTNHSAVIDSAKIHKIELRDGSQFIGNILQKNSVYIVIKTSSIPKIEIPIEKIKSIREVDKSNFKDGTYWFTNPNATRYFFSPSAFNLQKGDGYYQNTYLLLNSFNVGITNNVSVGGGIELTSTINSLSNHNSSAPIFFITPKVGFKVINKVHVGGGVLYINTPNFSTSRNRNSLGIAYGMSTYGSLNHNITGGIGWRFLNGNFSEKPIITFSGMTRITKRAALVTENWILPTETSTANHYGIYSYGIRFFGEKVSVDLAFLNNREFAQIILIGIPYVDFVVKF